MLRVSPRHQGLWESVQCSAALVGLGLRDPTRLGLLRGKGGVVGQGGVVRGGEGCVSADSDTSAHPEQRKGRPRPVWGVAGWGRQG